MAKLTAFINQPTKPNDRFHALETTTPREKMPTTHPWDLVATLLDHSDTKKRNVGLWLNAVLTENKLTHFFSGKIFCNLLSEQNLIQRKTMSHQEASSFLDYLVREGLVEILRPVLKAIKGVRKIDDVKAGVVRVTIPEISDYINLQIGKELSEQYCKSALNFYDEVPQALPLKTSTESSTSTSTTSTTTYTNTAAVKAASQDDVVIEVVKGTAAEPSLKATVPRPSFRRPDNTSVTNSTVHPEASSPKVPLKGSPSKRSADYQENVEDMELLQYLLANLNKLSGKDQKNVTNPYNGYTRLETLNFYGFFKEGPRKILKEIKGRLDNKLTKPAAGSQKQASFRKPAPVDDTEKLELERVQRELEAEKERLAQFALRSRGNAEEIANKVNEISEDMQLSRSPYIDEDAPEKKHSSQLAHFIYNNVDCRIKGQELCKILGAFVDDELESTFTSSINMYQRGQRRA